jgi:hypothetical protein
MIFLYGEESRELSESVLNASLLLLSQIDNFFLLARIKSDQLVLLKVLIMTYGSLRILPIQETKVHVLIDLCLLPELLVSYNKQHLLLSPWPFSR